MAHSHTLKLNPHDLDILKKYYHDYHIQNVPYSLFRAQKPGCMITAYTSGKVLFQGKNIEDELQILAQKYNFITLNKQTSSLNHSLPQAQQFACYIGNDEVGNGSYFGPLTVCSVYLDSNQIELIKELGATDSKKLSDLQIQTIAADLKHCLPYHLTICSPAMYNQAIQSQHNAVSIKVSLHNDAILKLIQQLNPQQKNNLETVVIDEFTSANNYFRHLSKEPTPYQGKVHFVQKAESQYLAVACASIIARDAFVKELNRLGQPFGKKLPSGAGPQVDVFGKELVKKYGKEVLASLAKLHFKNTQKILGSDSCENNDY